MKQASLLRSFFILIAMLVFGTNVQAVTMVSDNQEPSLTGKKWYSTKEEYIEFFEDGTNTYISSCTYVHDRKNDRILFYNANGILHDYVNIYVLTDTTLTIGKTTFKTYYSKRPKQLCEELRIFFNRITIKKGHKAQFPIRLLPDNADDKSVSIYGYDPEIVMIEGEFVIALSPGTTTIYVKTNDGSNLYGSFEVIVPDDTMPESVYQLDGVTYPMISQVDLGLPSGTQWADMNLGADAPFRMSGGFEGPIDVAPYVGSDWVYPTETDFMELIENCDVTLERAYSDFYMSYTEGYRYYELVAVVFISRLNGNMLHVYAFTDVDGQPYYMYPYCLQDGTSFSILYNVKECAPSPEAKPWVDQRIKQQGTMVLIRLVKRNGAVSVKGVVKMEDEESEAAPMYDLQGRRLSTQPSKGLYIQKGKKYLVK